MRVESGMPLVFSLSLSCVEHWGQDMSLRVSGKNFSIGEALREHVLQRINTASARYFDGAVTGHIVVDHEEVTGLDPSPRHTVAVYEVEDGLIRRVWFY